MPEDSTMVRHYRQSKPGACLQACAKMVLAAPALAHELFGAMQAQGWGDLEHSAVMRVIELLSDVEVRTREG
jgi:hypothetical protein